MVRGIKSGIGTMKSAWNRWNYVIIGLFMFAQVSYADVATAPSLDPPEVDLWFSVGERITYQIYWGIIPVGESVASTDWVDFEGRTLLAIRFRTKTNKVLSSLYPVDDLIESIVDPETFLPVQFTKRLSEGRYRCHEITRFDHEKGIAQMSRPGRERVIEYAIEPDTRDIATFMYYMRENEMEPGETYEYRVMADEEIYDLYVKTEKYEKVKTVDGERIESLLMEPEAKFEGLFVRSGKMWLWVSRGEDRVLTKMVAKVPVASVKLILHDIEDPAKDQ
ncbi:MAG: DUF3108 domain-containing protein [Spartobacteria bacterium]|nr:DUF3108 domain-containing protein [Spartobacteria bacterium]